MSGPTYLLFDIDGTVLSDVDNLHSGVGLEFLKCLDMLAARGFRFAFITGNDFNLQRGRILNPIIERGLGPNVFCFSDGGSRAFEFSIESKDFCEIEKYSKPNVMTPGQVHAVERAFESSVRPFLKKEPSLLVPSVLWYKPADDYIEIRIGPLRPTFLNDKQRYDAFCREVTRLGGRPDVPHAKITIVPGKPGHLIVHLLGWDILPAVSGVVNYIHTAIFSRPEYHGLSEPELEKRGGDVTCQIALKPFNRQDCRKEFRDIIAAKLERTASGQFEVLLGGSTTVDIQLRGVDKQKAVRFLASHWKISAADMVYFGNEFGLHGNDLAVARMSDNERPIGIVNVGSSSKESGLPGGRVFEDKNGPVGTVNYLKFLLLHL